MHEMQNYCEIHSHSGKLSNLMFGTADFSTGVTLAVKAY
jgi:hypothetical protein